MISEDMKNNDEVSYGFLSRKCKFSVFGLVCWVRYYDMSHVSGKTRGLNLKIKAFKSIISKIISHTTIFAGFQWLVFDCVWIDCGDSFKLFRFGQPDLLVIAWGVCLHSSK